MNRKVKAFLKISFLPVSTMALLVLSFQNCGRGVNFGAADGVNGLNGFNEDFIDSGADLHAFEQDPIEISDLQDVQTDLDIPDSALADVEENAVLPADAMENPTETVAPQSETVAQSETAEPQVEKNEEPAPTPTVEVAVEENKEPVQTDVEPAGQNDDSLGSLIVDADTENSINDPNETEEETFPASEDGKKDRVAFHCSARAQDEVEILPNTNDFVYDVKNIRRFKPLHISQAYNRLSLKNIRSLGVKVDQVNFLNGVDNVGASFVSLRSNLLSDLSNVGALILKIKSDRVNGRFNNVHNLITKINANEVGSLSNLKTHELCIQTSKLGDIKNVSSSHHPRFLFKNLTKAKIIGRMKNGKRATAGKIENMNGFLLLENMDVQSVKNFRGVLVLRNSSIKDMSHVHGKVVLLESAIQSSLNTVEGDLFVRGSRFQKRIDHLLKVHQLP